MAESASITVVIPTYSRLDLLRRAIGSVLAQTAIQPQVLVVDNGSPARLCDSVARDFGAQVKILRLERNLFFCGAANRGVRAATTSVVAVLNDDCWVECDWGEHVLQTFARDSGVGSVASLIYRGSGEELVDSAGAHMDVTGMACGIGASAPLPI